MPEINTVPSYPKLECGDLGIASDVSVLVTNYGYNFEITIYFIIISITGAIY